MVSPTVTPWGGNAEAATAWYEVRAWEVRQILDRLLPDECQRLEVAGKGGLRFNTWLYRWSDGTPLDAVVHGAERELALHGLTTLDRFWVVGLEQTLRSMWAQSPAELEARLALAALGAG
jgi:hypothetical protein